MNNIVTNAVLATAMAGILATPMTADAGKKEDRLWGYGLGALALGAMANHYHNPHNYYYTGSYYYPGYGYSYPSYSYGYSYPSYSYSFSYPSYSTGYYYY